MKSSSADAHTAFQTFVFSTSHLTAFRARVHGVRKTLIELLPIVERLNQQHAGTYRTLGDLTAAVGCQPPSTNAIRALRDVFIDIVDSRLQSLYRDHFRTNPPLHLLHGERIRALETQRSEALRLVSGYDWKWLAGWMHLHSIGEGVQTCLDRLSNFAFTCRRVNFRFTYHCNISCRHCYNNSGPYANRQRLDLGTMRRIVAEMPEVGIRALNLTGGEPFLYRDDVMALVEAGRSAGLREISIYSNGFWASTTAQARSVLERLARAGFGQGPNDHLKISGGVYHEEFISFDRILVLARTYQEFFRRRLRLDFEVAPGEGPTADDIHARIAAAGLSDRVVVNFRTIQPLGRAQFLGVASLDPIDRPCGVIDQIVFDPDGTARPCCGLNNDNQGVRIGRTEHSLRDLIKRMQNDPVLQFLSTHPMSDIFEHVAPRKNPLGYGGPCALCQTAVGGLEDKEALQARLFASQKFYPFWFQASEISTLPSSATTA